MNPTSVKLPELAFASAALALISFFQFLRISPALPTIMKDEYLYSMMSRKRDIAESGLGNFLYLRLFGETSACGVEFYSCVRVANFFFLFLFLVCLYLLARMILSRSLSFMAVCATGLGPIALYASVFMPDIMFFSLVCAAFLFLIKFAEIKDYGRPPIYLAGLFLAMSTLVKPQGVFVLAAAGIYIFVTMRGENPRAPVAFYGSVGFTAGVLLLKLGIGFSLAGMSGLTLFGDRYSSILLNALQVIDESPGLSSTTISSATPIEGPVSLVVLEHFFLSFALISILLLPYVGRLSGLSDTARSLWRLIALTLIVMLPVSALFAGYATATGDDHSDRILLRYFEFLIPIAMVLAMSTIRSSAKSSRVTLLVILVSHFLSVILVLLIRERTWVMADSAYMFALTSSGLAIAVWVAVICLSFYMALSRERKAQSVMAGALTIAVTLIGQLGVSHQVERNSVPLGSDNAGLYLRDNLPSGLEGSDVLFLGSNSQLLEGAMFLADLDDASEIVYESGSIVPNEAIGREFKVVVQTLGVRLAFLPEATYVGDGFLVSYLD